MKYLFIFLVSLSLSGCFSSKGLPVKSVPESDEVNTNATLEEEEVTRPKVTSKADLDHSEWNKLLKKHVQENGDVDYKGFKADVASLENYVNYLSKQVPEQSWTVEEQLAYFINVYNANTIKLIVDNYPLKSIKDISSPWLKNRVKIGDKDFSLADIENGVLRKMNEPRIHFAINCASKSCPKLLNEAFTAKNVMELMDKATKEFINNSSKNEIASGQLKISEVFKWYKSDFTENGTVVDYINQFSKTKINSATEINYKDYDWSLNDKN
jgi:hypothetical protein